jgi:hypothetical protein
VRAGDPGDSYSSFIAKGSQNQQLGVKLLCAGAGAKGRRNASAPSLTIRRSATVNISNIKQLPLLLLNVNDEMILDAANLVN